VSPDSCHDVCLRSSIGLYSWALLTANDAEAAIREIIGGMEEEL
jgi:hypothetical protein